MPDEPENRHHRLLPPAYFLGSILLMISLHLFLPIFRWRWGAWKWLGLAPALIGVALNMAADTQFKQKGTTVKPFQRSSALVTGGVFRISRNPMYLGMISILAGLGVWLGSLSPLAVLPLFAGWLNVKFVGPEERILEEQFGPAFQAYRSQVHRWL